MKPVPAGFSTSPFALPALLHLLSTTLHNGANCTPAATKKKKKTRAFAAWSGSRTARPLPSQCRQDSFGSQACDWSGGISSELLVSFPRRPVPPLAAANRAGVTRHSIAVLGTGLYKHIPSPSGMRRKEEIMPHLPGPGQSKFIRTEDGAVKHQNASPLQMWRVRPAGVKNPRLLPEHLASIWAATAQQW